MPFGSSVVSTPFVDRRDEDACQAAISRSLSQATARNDPYPHWLLTQILPPAAIRSICRAPISPPLPSACWIGDEERLSSLTRLTSTTTEAFPICGAIADAFRSPATAGRIARLTGLDLSRCRIEIGLAQHVGHFRQDPHTGAGFAAATLVIHLDNAGQRGLGVDLYRDRETWAGQAPGDPGSAILIAATAESWRGFEPRQIREVRKTLVVDWKR